jgi:hypothetical protein
MRKFVSSIRPKRTTSQVRPIVTSACDMPRRKPGFQSWFARSEMTIRPKLWRLAVQSIVVAQFS